MARLEEDQLRDAAHDAFMAFWRGADSGRAALWTAYSEAQERYDAYFAGEGIGTPLAVIQGRV